MWSLFRAQNTCGYLAGFQRAIQQCHPEKNSGSRFLTGYYPARKYLHILIDHFSFHIYVLFFKFLLGNSHWVAFKKRALVAGPWPAANRFVWEKAALASCFIEHASWEGGLNILLSPRSRELSGLPAAMGMGNAPHSSPFPSHPFPLFKALFFFVEREGHHVAAGLR